MSDAEYRALKKQRMLQDAANDEAEENSADVEKLECDNIAEDGNELPEEEAAEEEEKAEQEKHSE